MARYTTTDSLIESIKNRAFIPENQNTFSESSFLTFINEEMDIGIVPHVSSYREDYFLHTVTVDTVIGQDRYSIPHRAIGNKLREISYEDENGSVYEMRRIGVGDVPYYQYGNTGSNYNRLRAYYLEGDEIVMLPLGGGSLGNAKLRISYYMRPNSLVSEDSVGKVTAINTTTGEITLASIPTSFLVSNLYDIVKTRSPFNAVSIDLTPTAITGTTLTFNPSDLPRDFKVGDYVCLAEETIIPAIPPELHSILAQRVACRCLEALGDAQGLAAANAKLAEMEQKTISLLDNRVEDSPFKIVNRHGFLRMGRKSLRR